MNCYEVYVYLDPRKPGEYIYGDYKFNYLPVYVGKGSLKWRRKYVHLRKSGNRSLRNLIHCLRRNNLSPIVESVVCNIAEEKSHEIEKQLINLIGRKDKGNGPLFNFTDGGEGSSGIKYTPSQIEVRRKNMLKFWQSLTTEQRKEIGRKSLKNRNRDKIKQGISKRKITFNQMSVDERKQIELKRFNSWQKSIQNHTQEKKRQISQICKFASTKLRKQYFITIKDIDSNQVSSKFLNDWLQEGFARDGIMNRIKLNSTQPLFSRTTKRTIQIISWKKMSPAVVS